MLCLSYTDNWAVEVFLRVLSQFRLGAHSNNTYLTKINLSKSVVTQNMQLKLLYSKIKSKVFVCELVGTMFGYKLNKKFDEQNRKKWSEHHTHYTIFVNNFGFQFGWKKYS